MGIDNSDRELREAIGKLRQKTGYGEHAKSKDRTGDQPMPAEGRGPWIQDLVLQDLAERKDPNLTGPLAAAVEERKALGLSRYGTLLQAFNGRDVLQDAVDEAVDLVIYLRQALTEAAEKGSEARRAHLAVIYHSSVENALQLAFIYSASWS